MLHPEAQHLLQAIERRQLPAAHTLDAVQARAQYRQRVASAVPSPPPPAHVAALQAPGPRGPIGLRTYRPWNAAADDILPALAYFHGGGWVTGDLDTHDVLCRQLADLARCCVVAVGYRLAPEHRFPAAVEDAVAATRWVQANAAELKVDGSRLAVGGDSAGGNLAAVVALTARDSGDLPLCFQLLIYPATDQRRGWPSYAAFGDGYLLTRQAIDHFYNQYAGRPDRLDWRLSPLLHHNHAGLPPALVLTAGCDPLHDEGLHYAQALSAAGSPVTQLCFERQLHGFVLMAGLLAEAQAAIEVCAARLRHAFSPQASSRQQSFGPAS